MTCSLHVKDIGLYYGSTLALKGINFEVSGGEFVSIIGPSGSGKTSLLQVIAGIRRPSIGVVEIGGEDVTLKPVYERNIGVVFQGYALFPHMTAYDNIAFPLRAGRHKTDAQTAQTKVKNMLATLGLGGLERRRPSELSGGQQQRVALARALVFDPEILLLDEPLTALDRNLRSQLGQEISSLQRRLGITTVFVTHDITEAMVMSQRIIVLRDGVIERMGTPRELYENPGSLFVAKMVGEVNVLRGTIVGTEREGILRLQIKSFSLLVPVHSLLKQGATAIIGIRPEKIRLQEVANRKEARNRLPAQLLHCSYMGNSTKLVVRVADMVEWELLVPPDERPCSVQAELEVEWDVLDTKILEED